MSLSTIRFTSNSAIAGGARLMLAIIFLMTGLMKLLVPQLAAAWSGQLLAAGIPFYEIAYSSIPYLEVALGLALAFGLHARASAIVVIGIMVVATYVHIVVGDPSLFPLQPKQPFIPIAVIVMSLYTLWRGAGAWSMDLRAS